MAEPLTLWYCIRVLPPVHVIGVPLDLGGNRRGVDMGPSAFRIAGLGEKIAQLGHAVVDKGDLPSAIPEIQHHGDPTKKFIDEIARVCDQVYQSARASIEEGAIPLVLGGDDSLATGSVAASAAYRSEEHTSELQSPDQLVCRLLLEKK